MIDEPVFSCVVGLCKPDPRIYRLALERLSVQAEESLFVGDGDGLLDLVLGWFDKKEV